MSEAKNSLGQTIPAHVAKRMADVLASFKAKANAPWDLHATAYFCQSILGFPAHWRISVMQGRDVLWFSQDPV